mmetsp:Transcript_82395/g.150838  ORF Transcript_82395/g.150838 Transcript_82395/m.150838 type:complete len:212 (-) Transcript_82395:622-1257(-)
MRRGKNTRFKSCMDTSQRKTGSFINVESAQYFKTTPSSTPCKMIMAASGSRSRWRLSITWVTMKTNIKLAETAATICSCIYSFSNSSISASASPALIFKASISPRRSSSCFLNLNAVRGSFSATAFSFLALTPANSFAFCRISGSTNLEATGFPSLLLKTNSWGSSSEALLLLMSKFISPASNGFLSPCVMFDLTSMMASGRSSGATSGCL